MQNAINAVRFNVKLYHCLTRKKKHDLDQETIPRSLWNVKEQLHTTYMYSLPNIISWGYGRQVQSGYYGTIKARPMHACIYSQLPII